MRLSLPARWLPSTRVRAAAWVTFAYATAVLAVHHPLLTAGHVLGGDADTSYWQDLTFAIGSLRRGELPLWNAWDRGGYPFWVDPQTACFAPLTWLLWLLGVVTGSDGPWLQAVRQLGTCVLAAAGMHGFLRSRGLHHGACFLAGSVMALGGLARANVTMATYWPFAYVGFCLWAFERLAQAPTRTHAQRCLVALLLLLTSGFPPGIFYVLLIVLPYVALRTLQVRSPAMIGWLLAIAAACATAAWVVFAPVHEQMQLSARSERGLGYVLSSPLQPISLATLWKPAPLRTSIFVGYAALTCAPLGFFSRRTRILAVFAAAVGASGLTLALGAQGHVLAWLALHVPGFDLFRIASRYALLVQAALAILGAAGAHSAMTWAALRARPSARIVMWSGLACVQGLSLLQNDPPGTYAKPPRINQALVQKVAQDTIYNEWSLGARPGSRVRVRDWRGRSLDPMIFARYLQAEERVSRDPAILAHFGVQWALLGGRSRVPSPPRLVHPATIATREGKGVWRVHHPSPVAYWTNKLVEVREGGALDAMLSVQPGTYAFVESTPPERGTLTTRAKPVAATVRLRSARALTVDVHAPQAGMVVVNEVWHPHWHARVDGQPVTMQRVNHVVRGVEVPAGTHTIAMQFWPPLYSWGFPAYFLCWLVALMPVRMRMPMLLHRLKRART